MVRRHGLPWGVGLDLGCGDGKLTAILDEMCGDAADRTWVGVDIDPDETALARSMGLYARVHTGSADRIDEPDESFDFAFSNSVLEHVEPIQAVLREASRVLKRGGRFIATVPGPGFHDCLAGGGASPAGRAAYLRETDARCAHLRYWSQAEWRAELAAAGLELAIARPYLTERQVRRWETLATWTGGLAYRVFGKTRRPIEVQRLFRMPAGGAGALAGALGDRLAPLWASAARSPGTTPPARRGACWSRRSSRDLASGAADPERAVPAFRRRGGGNGRPERGGPVRARVGRAAALPDGVRDRLRRSHGPVRGPEQAPRLPAGGAHPLVGNSPVSSPSRAPASPSISCA